MTSGPTTTFADNTRLPVHRWFRYSAGFSGAWAEATIRQAVAEAGDASAVRVLDPFAGCGTTLIAAEDAGVPSVGLEPHPFVARVAQAKLARQSSPEAFETLAGRVAHGAGQGEARLEDYPELIRRCYSDENLAALDRLRRALVEVADGSAPAQLVWLALVTILRPTSHAGTANWQYLLPDRRKVRVLEPLAAYRDTVAGMARDMRYSAVAGPSARLLQADARWCEGVEPGWATLVLTSPPYPNNFDYADATRLEQTFLGEVASWSDLQQAVRRHLLRSCSQHVSPRSLDLDQVLADPAVEPIRQPLAAACGKLAGLRQERRGRKAYHLMVACYFADLARTWQALRGACARRCQVCFVVGDSAPYGVHIPVADWLGELALAAGFGRWRFEKTRDRNTKWRNRKHRVPLVEGRLWVTSD